MTMFDVCPICDAPVERWSYARHFGACLSLEMLRSEGPVILVRGVGTRRATPEEQAGLDAMTERLRREKYARGWLTGGSGGSSGPPSEGDYDARADFEGPDPLGPPWDERGDAAR